MALRIKHLARTMRAERTSMARDNCRDSSNFHLSTCFCNTNLCKTSYHFSWIVRSWMVDIQSCLLPLQGNWRKWAWNRMQGHFFVSYSSRSLLPSGLIGSTGDQFVSPSFSFKGGPKFQNLQANAGPSCIPDQSHGHLC